MTRRNARNERSSSFRSTRRPLCTCKWLMPPLNGWYSMRQIMNSHKEQTIWVGFPLHCFYQWSSMMVGHRCTFKRMTKTMRFIEIEMGSLKPPTPLGSVRTKANTRMSVNCSMGTILDASRHTAILQTCNEPAIASSFERSWPIRLMRSTSNYPNCTWVNSNATAVQWQSRIANTPQHIPCTANWLLKRTSIVTIRMTYDNSHAIYELNRKRRRTMNGCQQIHFIMQRKFI